MFSVVVSLAVTTLGVKTTANTLKHFNATVVFITTHELQTILVFRLSHSRTWSPSDVLSLLEILCGFNGG